MQSKKILIEIITGHKKNNSYFFQKWNTFKTVEMSRTTDGSRDFRTAEIRHVDPWRIYGPNIYVPNFLGPKIAAPGMGGGGLNFSFRPKFRG